MNWQEILKMMIEQERVSITIKFRENGQISELQIYKFEDDEEDSPAV